MPATTIGSYLHLLDLETVKLLEQWPTRLNRRNAFISVITLAKLLGVDRSRVRQLIAAYNVKHPQALLLPIKPIPPLPDGARSGPELRSHYLPILEAMRLLQWVQQQ